MFKDLDPLLHQQLRLQIMTLLMNVETAEFNYLLKETGATRGNLSVQIKKLQEANYLTVSKTFRNNYPLTTCARTDKGREAFTNYVEALEGYFSKRK
jgi:DNA-binding MarR family transcriptional regulator